MWRGSVLGHGSGYGWLPRAERAPVRTAVIRQGGEEGEEKGEGMWEEEDVADERGHKREM